MKKTLTLFIVAAFCLPVFNVNADERGLNLDKFELKAPKPLRVVSEGSDGSNGPGVIQIGLGWGVTLGGATIINKYPGGSTTDKGVGLNTNLGLRAQYGLAKFFSAGIFIRRENAIYVTSNASPNASPSSSSTTLGTNGFGFGLEGKIYPVNKEKFALYIAPRIGFSTVKTNFYDSNFSVFGKANGLNYGVTAGFNWWWAKFIGMSLDLGYSGSNLNGIYNDPLFQNNTYTLKNGGFYFGLGLITKFGG